MAEEDILNRPGTLRSTSSWGSMISDSISLGAEARQGVITLISGREMSGVIWIGSRVRLMMPKMAIRMQATTTATGFDNEIFVRVNTFARFPQRVGNYTPY